MPVHIVQGTCVCPLPNNSVALLGYEYEDEIKKIHLTIVNVWSCAEVMKTFLFPNETNPIVPEGFVCGSMLYLPNFDLILTSNVYTRKIMYYKFDEITQELKVIRLLPEHLPKDLPKRLYDEGDLESSCCFVKMDPISGALFCYEYRDENEIYNYMWDDCCKEWLSVNLPSTYAVRFIELREDGEGFVAIVRNATTDDNFRALINWNGEVPSMETMALRNETIGPFYSLDSKRIFALSKTLDRKNDPTRWDVESYDVTGKLITQQQLPLPNDCYYDICEVGGRLIICSV